MKTSGKKSRLLELTEEYERLERKLRLGNDGITPIFNPVLNDFPYRFVLNFLP